MSGSIDESAKSQNEHFSPMPKNGNHEMCKNPDARVTFLQSTAMTSVQPKIRKLALVDEFHGARAKLDRKFCAKRKIEISITKTDEGECAKK